VLCWHGVGVEVYEKLVGIFVVVLVVDPLLEILDENGVQLIVHRGLIFVVGWRTFRSDGDGLDL